MAKAYADYRLIDLIQAKLDSLPKPKEKKGGKRKGRMEGKSKALSKPQTPAIPEIISAKQEVEKPILHLHLLLTLIVLV